MNTPIPKQVQRQIDAANAMAAQMAEAAKQPPAVPLTPLTEASVPPAPVESPAPAPEPAPAPPPPAPAPADSQLAKLQNDFRAIQGQLRAQEERHRNEVAAMRQQLQEAATKVQAPEPPQKPTFNAEDIDRFGADMLEMVTRQAKETFDRLSAQFQAPLKALSDRISALEGNIGQVAQTATQSREDQFYTLLESLVPDYKQINESQEWLQWLDEADPTYGVPRQAALDRAFQALDARHTAKIFQVFKDSRPKPPAKPTDSLASQVAPHSATAGTPAAPAAPEVISQASIIAFYDDVRRGKYRGREEEVARYESIINRAYQEGRIR